MAGVQRGDQAAFSRLVGRHLSTVHRYLRRLTGSAADADELSQETFLRIWQRSATYRPGTVRLTTWMHRIAHNLAVDDMRRQRPEPTAAGEEPGDDAANPEAQALSAEALRHLHTMLNALPANQRAALLLCQVQGFSNREAAGIVGVSTRSLESLLARARRSLRLALSEGDDVQCVSTDHDGGKANHDTA